jgi:hypothetical protein
MEERLEIAGPEVAPAGGVRTELTPARLLFRFALGAGWLASEWLAAALRVVDELPAPADGPEDVVPIDARAVLAGAVSSALRRRRPRAVAPSTALRRRGRQGLRLLTHLPGAGLVERRLDSFREAALIQFGQWAQEGARETLAGRRLARLAAPGLFELAVARLAQSPELRKLIAEQSQGLASSTVAELRQRSERADTLIEDFLRRILGRGSTADSPESAAP